MKVILKAQDSVASLLGSAVKEKDAQYRPFTYINTVLVDDGLLLYNTASAELILLDNLNTHNGHNSSYQP